MRTTEKHRRIHHFLLECPTGRERYQCRLAGLEKAGVDLHGKAKMPPGCRTQEHDLLGPNIECYAAFENGVQPHE